MLVEEGTIVGYGVISVAADEAHILNVCVAPERQSRGYGRRLLRALIKYGVDLGARRVFLEVRPSNPNAIALYHSDGFNEIGRRPRYYPAANGREDALVMAIELFFDGMSCAPARPPRAAWGFLRVPPPGCGRRWRKRRGR